MNALKTLTQGQGCSVDGTQTVQNPMTSLVNKLLMPNKMNQNKTEVYKESLRIVKSNLSPFDRVKLDAIQHTYKVRDINQILKDACSKGDIETVRQIISEGAVDFGESLINACEGGHIDIVHLIMSIGYFDGFNEGFKYACLEGHIDIVHLIISKRNVILNTGLIRACKGGHIDIVNLIISKADSLKYDLDFNIGLNFACYGGNIDIVNLLISKGANDWNGGLLYACENRQFDIIELMISKGAKLTSRITDQILFNDACSKGRLNTISLMMQLDNFDLDSGIRYTGKYKNVVKFLENQKEIKKRMKLSKI
jgi:ankyrin repeat protein